MAARRRVAVVGAGIAGLAAARALSDAGDAPTVFEKSRGLGGRLSWRRGDFGALDHGAQFVTASGDAFARYLDDAEHAGAVVRWPAAEAARADGRRAYVGLPGMSGLVRPLAETLDIVTGVRVGALSRSDDGWRLADDGAESLGLFDAVLLAIPAPQAALLLEGHALEERLAETVYAPCWTGLFAFENRLDLPDIARAEDGALAWVARDGAKPGRDGGYETFVVQAGPNWSRANLERAPAAVADELLAALLARAGAKSPPPLHAAAHRWRYARVERALGEPCLFDAEAGLAVSGDFCLGPRAEAAFDSGLAAAAALSGTWDAGLRRA